METNPSASGASTSGDRRGLRIALIATLAMFLIAVGFWIYSKIISTRPLSESLGSVANNVNLYVKVLDQDNKPVADSIFLQAGTSSSASSSTTTENIESIKLIPRRVALSIYPMNAAKLIDWFEQDRRAAELSASPLLMGFLQPVFDTLNIDAADYNLETVKGQFLRTCLKEIILAGAALHFDTQEGGRGVVLSFRRKEASLTSKVLPLLLDRIVRTQWNVSGLVNPIWESILGKHKLFVYEAEGRVYFAQSLRALLNLLHERLDSQDGSVGGGDSHERISSPTLRLILRSDAWVDNLIPLFVGQVVATKYNSKWPIEVDLTLVREQPAQLHVRTPEARVFSQLKTRIDSAVLSAVPGDAFMFFVSSFQLPSGMSATAWTDLALRKVSQSASPSADTTGGFAIVWDLNKNEPNLSEIGIVLAAPSTPQPQDLTVTDYVRDVSLATTCSDGKVWLLSTTPTLLTRLREACEGTSKSINDGGRLEPILQTDTQLFLGLQLGNGMEQLYQAGAPSLEIPSAGEPAWKADYRTAVQNLHRLIEPQVRNIPPLFLTGRADMKSGASLNIFNQHDR